MRFPPVSKRLHINGQPVVIYGIATGGVSVKTKFRDADKKGVLAQLEYSRDMNFTEWMPIWVWVIVHPEGIILVDTGETSMVMDKDYFTSSGKFAIWLNTTQFKFEINSEDEIQHQLQKLGIATSEIRTIILTHLHPDHVGGLKHFEKTNILIHNNEWNNPHGSLPKLFPSWLSPHCIDLDESYDCFPKTKNLTKDNKIKLIATPGHTFGHCSVVLESDEAYVFFAGDLTYNQHQLINNIYSGAIADYDAAQESYEIVRQFAIANNLVYLPAHDVESGNRLKNMLPLSISK